MERIYIQLFCSANDTSGMANPRFYGHILLQFTHGAFLSLAPTTISILKTGRKQTHHW